MDHAACLTAIAAGSADLSSAARTAGLDAGVPTCPGWSVADLVAHVGGVQRWATRLVAGSVVEPSRRDRNLPVPPGAARFDWFDEGAAALVETLTDAGTDRPVWNFLGEAMTSAFWARRQAHEVAVHRFDAEAAAGTATPADPVVAADGIDELLTVLAPRLVAAKPVDGLNGTLHVHCTDTEGEWLAALRPDGIDVTREHAKGDAALRGPALAALLVLYGRIPVLASAAEVIGDAGVLDRWSTGVRF